LIEIANFRGTTSDVFEFLDLPFNRFLSAHSVLLIISLIFSGPLGIVSFCLVIWGLIIVRGTDEKHDEPELGWRMIAPGIEPVMFRVGRCGDNRGCEMEHIQ